MLKKIPILCALTACSLPALSADLNIKVNIPRLDVAEYHRPYLAFWVEDAQKSPTTLAVWYDLNMKNGEGSKWLKDMRQWWRKQGRELDMPLDGVTSATRAPGSHNLNLNARQGPLSTLKPGEYRLYIEAAREVGGREVVSIPFTWPSTKPVRTVTKGQSELGTVTLEIKP